MKFSPILLITIFLGLSLGGFSQTRTLDSLNKLLKNDKEDTNKVNHLNGISFELRNTDPEKSFALASEGMKIAEKLNYWKGITQSFIWMGTATLNMGKAEEAIPYLQKGNHLANEHNFKSLEAKSFISMALVHNAHGNFNECLKAWNDALALLQLLGEKKNIGSVYNGLGNAYTSQGRYSEGLSNHLKALKIRTEMNDKNGIAGSYNNIGNVYKDLGNNTEALSYYYKAVEINKETGNKSWLANNYGNISAVYFNLAVSPNLLKEGKSADQYFFDARETAMKALKIKEEMGDKIVIASLYHNVALIDVAQAKIAKEKGDKKTATEKLNTALKIYNDAVKIRGEIGDKDGLSKDLENIALALGEMGKYKEGRKYFEESMRISKEIGSLAQIKSDYYGMAMFDSILGNYKGAYSNYRMFIKYRDSIDNKENSRKLVETRLNYEFEMKHNADSLKAQEREAGEKLRHDQEINQQKLYTFFGVIGFILMIVVAAVSFKAFRQKQRANSIITEQKIRLEVKQKEVMDSIEYAKRIQKSLMPSDKYLEKKLNELKKKI